MTTPEQLGAYAGIVLSLALFYIPGLNDWYSAQIPQKQAGIMALLLLGATLVIFGLSCANWYTTVSCDYAGAKQLVSVFIAALIANQSTYMLVRKSPRKLLRPG
jgi:hypothetical protein